MSAIEDIENAWRSYLITKDCLKITQKSLKDQRHNVLLKGSIFLETQLDEAMQEIEDCQQHADYKVLLEITCQLEKYKEPDND